MNIKDLIIIISILIILSIVVTDGREKRELPITSLEIQFDKTDATFIVNYNFDKLARIYLITFGSKSLESKIKSIFINFEYDIIKIDADKAILKVKNISRLNKGYYLHESRKFTETIGVINITDSFSTKTYFNTNSTPNYFYRQ
jgi:hypothetical protein